MTLDDLLGEMVSDLARYMAAHPTHPMVKRLEGLQEAIEELAIEAMDVEEEG